MRSSQTKRSEKTMINKEQLFSKEFKIKREKTEPGHFPKRENGKIHIIRLRKIEKTEREESRIEQNGIRGKRASGMLRMNREIIIGNTKVNIHKNKHRKREIIRIKMTTLAKFCLE